MRFALRFFSVHPGRCWAQIQRCCGAKTCSNRKIWSLASLMNARSINYGTSKILLLLLLAAGLSLFSHAFMCTCAWPPERFGRPNRWATVPNSFARVISLRRKNNDMIPASHRRVSTIFILCHNVIWAVCLFSTIFQIFHLFDLRTRNVWQLCRVADLDRLRAFVGHFWSF